VVKRTLSDVMKDLRHGEVDMDAGIALSDLVQAVRETGRGGVLRLELKVQPVQKGNGEQVVVTDVIKVKKPEPQNGTTVLFTTEENVLARKDPRQPELSGLRKVEPVADFKSRSAEGTNA